MVSLVPSSGKPEIIVTEPTNNQPSQNNPVRSKSEFKNFKNFKGSYHTDRFPLDFFCVGFWSMVTILNSKISSRGFGIEVKGSDLSLT